MHDSPDHKNWVEALAIRLRKNGIDAILDQWDASPGDDLTLFMEEGVTQSDRVIVVCTPNYVAKADAGVGGVGYERMIVTAELVKNIGTNKFIPVIRNALPERRVPKFLATRVFIDFSNGQSEDDAVDTLLRELHKVPLKRKPPLGTSPYALSPLGEEAAAPKASNIERSLGEGLGSAILDSPTPMSAFDSYNTSRSLAMAGAEVQWQRVSKHLAIQCASTLLQWRQQRENVRTNTADDTKKLLDEAVKQLAPLFAFSMAGVESGRQTFGDQSGLVLDLLAMRDWPQAGRRWFVNLPASLVWVFHNLHGALCTNTGQFNVALNLVERKVQSVGVQQFRRICQSHELLGWPEALEGNSGWNFIHSASDRWKWLDLMFQDGKTYLEAHVAYFMLLNIHELVLALSSSSKTDFSNPENLRLDIPLNFAIGDRETNRRAFQLLLQHPSKISEIWESRGVSRVKVESVWPQWMAACKFWVSRSSQGMFFHRHLEHATLFEAL